MKKMRRQDFILLLCAINSALKYRTWDEVEKELLPYFKKMGLKKKEEKLLKKYFEEYKHRQESRKKQLLI